MSSSELIYSYGAEQAVDDGVLVRPFPDTIPNVLFTAAVHSAIESKVTETRTYAQCAIPLIQDAMMVCRAKPNEHLWTEGLKGNVTGQDVWIALNEIGGITILFPSDY